MFDPLKRLKMGIQSTLEEVDFDKADNMASLSNSGRESAKSRWAAWMGILLGLCLSSFSRLVVHPKEEAKERARVEVVKVKEGKEAVPTREPDLKMELKRGSMRDKWGLTLVHRMGEGGRIELGISKVKLPCLFPINFLLCLLGGDVQPSCQGRSCAG